MATNLSVSVCIANYKQDHFLKEAIASCKEQTYKNEVIVYNDTEGVGSGEAFNRAIAKAKTDLVFLLCADDYFTDKNVIADMVAIFNSDERIGHVTRYYYQFVDGDKSPVRGWRVNDPFELANNPSGLAFRRKYLIKKDGTLRKLSNKMFVEAVTLVSEVLKISGAVILQYDTVAVRIHQSTARNQEYYERMWTSSPVEEWEKAGGRTLLRDFTSLVQIKNYYSTGAVLKESYNFLRLRPINILEPGFWFFAIVAVITPRSILIKLPELYRKTLGKWTTKEIKRL